MFANSGQASLKTERIRGQTVVTHQYSHAPLQWLGPLQPTSPRPIFYLRNPNGGLLQGDSHRIQLHLSPQTHLEIRSQSATRLHPGDSSQTVEIELAEDSSLIWINHPIIPGSGTRFQQQVRIRIRDSARLAYGEIWTSGRIGMGESWQFEHLVNHLQVWSQDQLHLMERMQLPHPHVKSLSVLADYPCWGSLYLLGDWPDPLWIPSPTQWQVGSPAGRILRSVGHDSHKLWLVFQQAVERLDSLT